MSERERIAEALRVLEQSLEFNKKYNTYERVRRELNNASYAAFGEAIRGALAALLAAQPEDVGEEVPTLRDRILWQNGSVPGKDDDAEYERVTAAADRKIRWAHAADFGAPVRVVWVGGAEDYGVLTTLPGFSEPDMDGVIHIPHPWAEKGEDDAIWITLNDCAALDDVQEIHVGARHPTKEAEDE